VAQLSYFLKPAVDFSDIPTFSYSSDICNVLTFFVVYKAQYNFISRDDGDDDDDEPLQPMRKE